MLMKNIIIVNLKFLLHGGHVGMQIILYGEQGKHLGRQGT